MDRHAILRTTYVMADGVPMQRITGWMPAILEQPDVQGLGHSSFEAQVNADFRRPFDLENGPVLRTVLYTRAPADHVLLIVAHHIALDGWSVLAIAAKVKKAAAHRGVSLRSPPCATLRARSDPYPPRATY